MHALVFLNVYANITARFCMYIPACRTIAKNGIWTDNVTPPVHFATTFPTFRSLSSCWFVGFGTAAAFCLLWIAATCRHMVYCLIAPAYYQLVSAHLATLFGYWFCCCTDGLCRITCVARTCGRTPDTCYYPTPPLRTLRNTALFRFRTYLPHITCRLPPATLLFQRPTITALPARFGNSFFAALPPLVPFRFRVPPAAGLARGAEHHLLLNTLRAVPFYRIAVIPACRSAKLVFACSCPHPPGLLCSLEVIIPQPPTT